MSLEIAGIFVAGMLTFLTPCVLSLVPIYLAALAGGSLEQVQAGRSWKLLLQAVWFSVGFVAVFTLMGLTASSIGGLLAAHRTTVQVAGGVLILLFGLKLLGIIQVPLLDRVARGDDQRLKTRFDWLNARL